MSRVRIDPGSRSMQGIGTFLAFVALNLLYLLTCVPVVTIGAATSALFEVTLRYSDDERGHPLRDYLPAFARNAARASLLSLILLLPLAALVFSAVFWWASPATLGAAAAIVSAAAAAYLFTAWLYAMALVAGFDSGVRRTAKNALLLPGAEPVRTAGIVLLPVAIGCLSVLFPAFLVIVGTIGFSVGAYASAFLFRSVFARHLP